MANTPYKPIPRVSRFKAILRTKDLLRNPIPVLLDGMKKHGKTYDGGFVARNMLVTRDPVIIEHILQKNHRNYYKSKIQTDHLGHFIGKGLLTANGDYWLRQRRLIQPGFHRGKLEGITRIMQEEIAEFLTELEPLANSNEPFDAARSMTDITFRIVSRSLFSASMSRQELKRIEFIITELQRFIIRTARLPFLAYWYRINGAYQRSQRLIRESDEILFRIIRERRASGMDHNDLLDMLLQTRYEDTGEGMTEQQLRDESLILFVAGHETTANALSWLLYLLSQNPEVEEKLLTEMDRVLGGRPPQFSDLSELTYTLQVIREGMRIFPPAWATDRVALEDDEVAGYFIPKGTTVAAFIGLNE